MTTDHSCHDDCVCVCVCVCSDSSGEETSSSEGVGEGGGVEGGGGEPVVKMVKVSLGVEKDDPLARLLKVHE